MSGPRVGDPLAPAVPLTARQAQVLRLIAAGYTNIQIGHQLGLTEDTVKSHIRRILTALGARGRAHAVHLAHERGLFKQQPCTGDRACYRRHQRRGERPCRKSIRANSAYARALRRAAATQTSTRSAA